jgi:hypothetical protein
MYSLTGPLAAWYYTHPIHGCIFKRFAQQEHSITKQNILEAFDGSTGEVVAHFIDTREISGQRTAATVRYFDRSSLRDFLYCDEAPRSGFLQKFVSVRSQRFAPTSDTGQLLGTIRACYARGALPAARVEQRTNVLKRAPPPPDTAASPRNPPAGRSQPAIGAYESRSDLVIPCHDSELNADIVSNEDGVRTSESRSSSGQTVTNESAAATPAALQSPPWLITQLRIAKS